MHFCIIEYLQITIVDLFSLSVSADIKEDDDEFEIIDASAGWVKKHFGDISKASVGKQVAVGGSTGWYVVNFCSSALVVISHFHFTSGLLAIYLGRSAKLLLGH